MVLKKDTLKPAEPYRVDGGAARDDPAPSGPTARIVRSTDRGAVVEVVCTCGKKMHVRCVYAGPAAGPEPPPADPPAQAGNG